MSSAGLVLEAFRVAGTGALIYLFHDRLIVWGPSTTSRLAVFTSIGFVLVALVLLEHMLMYLEIREDSGL